MLKLLRFPLLLVAFATSLHAQTAADPRVAQIDALAQKIEATAAARPAQTAPKADDAATAENPEKIVATWADDSHANLLLLRHEANSGQVKTENRFYFEAGKIVLWQALRDDTQATQSPRARKRLTQYYCADGKVFQILEKAAAAGENLDNQTFTPVPVADIAAMTEFLNRKFQHLLEAFQKAEGN